MPHFVSQALLTNDISDLRRKLFSTSKYPANVHHIEIHVDKFV